MSSYSEGQTHQLMERLESELLTPHDVTLLGQFNNWPGILDLIHGRAEIVPKRHVIDCDADPFLSESWSVEQHVKGGQLEWDPAKVALYLTEEQNCGSIKGDKLREELKSRHVLNANVLDYLLANPHLIPEAWKGKYVFFWGTIYRGPGGDLYVRCLDWGGDGWRWGCYWLDDGWRASNPALVLAS
ncbi:hypothetical protein BK004_02160 [bacterium CG10_46_32]|nr:MAG: hypothetical protein BK004_02160 [bacterium CG10_46_32]PIR56234.1 MAG: hypothetical protein COU73_02185 [Parcubacteria group bacterium CG10_big_fil_rev_8_21_14_0_10_46_32]